MKAYEMQEDWSVYFQKEDGTEFEARVIASFTTSNPKFERNNYCALYSQEFNPGKDEPIVLFRVDIAGNNEYIFSRVTDMEEAQAMFEAWADIIEAVQNNEVERIDTHE